MESVLRKRDTGEAGNRAEFGTVSRTEAAVTVDAPSPVVQLKSEDALQLGEDRQSITNSTRGCIIG